LTSGQPSSQPQVENNKENRINSYFSPPNEVAEPDDIERNPNKKQEAYDGAIEKLQSLIEEKQSRPESKWLGGRTGKIVSVTYSTSTN